MTQNEPPTTMRSRLEGGLLGLLIGDALGVPYEFHRPDEIPARDLIEMDPPIGFIRAHGDVPPGTWSDDGAQALCLLESLLETGGLDLHDLADRLQRWYRDGHMAVDGHVFDVGNQTLAALNALAARVPPDTAGPADVRSNGNGSLMRVLPLALWHQGPDLELAGLAARQSLPTHGHAQAQACCAWACLWARGLLHGRTDAWEWAGTVMEQFVEQQPQLRPGLESLWEFQQRTPQGSGYVLDTFWSAYQLLEQHDSYEDVIKGAVALGRDTDTTAAVAGGLAGIRGGIEAIPQRWRGALRGQDLVAPLLERLIPRRSTKAPRGAGRTSQTHPLRIDTIELPHPFGRIGVTFCPGKKQANALTGRWYRDLDTDLEAIRAWGARHLVTLIEPHEFLELQVPDLGERARAVGLVWHHLPIRDGLAPGERFLRDWRTVGALLSDALASGDPVVVHCKGGLGRAGCVAAMLLIELHQCQGGEEAIRRVRSVRTGAVETAMQESFIATYGAAVQHGT